MKCLLDTSIICRLIRYRLCSEALLLFGINRSDLLILREIEHHLQNNRDRCGQAIFSPKQLKRCHEFCKGLKQITNPFRSAAEAHALTTKHAIRHAGRTVTLDHGEAQLFAATGALKDWVIWTADNKSLIALALWPNCESIHTRVRKTVYCLERIVRELILEHGFSKIAGRIVNETGIVGTAIASGEQRCCNVLKASEQELQAACRGLLAD